MLVFSESAIFTTGINNVDVVAVICRRESNVNLLVSKNPEVSRTPTRPRQADVCPAKKAHGTIFVVLRKSSYPLVYDIS